MRYELFLAIRYLGSLRRSQPFVSVIAAISVLGVALGVAALLVVLGVMSGFDADLEAKILGSNPHLVVEMQGGIEQAQAEELISRLSRLPYVKAAAPFVQTQVLLRTATQASGVILRGVDPVREQKVTNLISKIQMGSWSVQPGEILLGSELAHRWGIGLGDRVTVAGLEKSPAKEMTVAGLFTTGMYDYDMHLSLASLETIQGLLGREGKVSGVGVRIDRAIQAPHFREALQRELGYPYWVMSWLDFNKNLFAALKLEKVTMFIILTLIVLVACFNIVATLLMVVVGKTKEIGILRAVGATGFSIRRIFTWVGILIGGVGTLLGAFGGLGLCGLLSKYQFIQLPASIYYIDRLPVKLEGWDAGMVILAALGLSWAACLYPAWVASRLKPAEAIRYE